MKYHFIAFTVAILSLLSFNLSLLNKDFRFNKDKKFRIVQFTDLHYGEPSKDIYTTEIAERLLNYTKPDLVAITGDSISGNLWDGTSKNFYQNIWTKFTAPFQTCQIPYAYTTGNHDTDADKGIEEIMALDITHPFSAKREYNKPVSNTELSFLAMQKLSGTGVSSSNYFIKIYSHDNEAKDSKVVAIVWFFDSGSMGCEDMKESWGCISSAQIQWYEHSSLLIVKELGYMPDGFAFFHIPLPEMRIAYNTQESYGGLRRQLLHCPNKQTHFFDSVKKMGNMKAMFCGHDHNNDFCVNHEGVELCYGRKTGYGSDGPTGFQRGARVIDLEEKTDDKGKVYFTYSQFTIQEDFSIQTQDYQRGFHGHTDTIKECVFLK
mmetsp:Transcript_2883/g.2959  ORF Transcript_2883/g.2959 Transcript_2883/m.2959 type:complete len:377 (+) Transcript_2883:12-1142(+)